MRNLEYKIIQVQKAVRDRHAFITTIMSPEQCIINIKRQITIDKELLIPIVTQPALVTEKERAKHNFLMLIVRNINKAKSINSRNEISIKTTLIGSNNVANVFFPNKEGQVHTNIPNVKVSTPATYKQYAKKNIKMLNHYVKFTPHTHNLDGLVALSEA